MWAEMHVSSCISGNTWKSLKIGIVFVVTLFHDGTQNVHNSPMFCRATKCAWLSAKKKRYVSYYDVFVACMAARSSEWAALCCCVKNVPTNAAKRCVILFRCECSFKITLCQALHLKILTYYE